MNCGNRYDISFGCCELVLGPVENYYTKTQVDKLIDDISGVTEEEVDEKIASATSGYVTENDLTGYTYDKTETNALLDDNALGALMSGSGPTVFAIFESREKAKAAAEAEAAKEGK